MAVYKLLTFLSGGCFFVASYLVFSENVMASGPFFIGFFLFGGYRSVRLWKMNERDCRTIAIEVGMQNGGLASGIAKEMGKIATIGLAPAIFGPLMNVTGSLLASWWHKNTPNNP